MNKKGAWTEGEAELTRDLFLRAGNPTQLTGCAIGFVRTIECMPSAELSQLETFLRVIGYEIEADGGAFKAAVEAAAVSLVCCGEGSAPEAVMRARRLADILAAAGLEPQANLEAVALAGQMLRAKS